MEKDIINGTDLEIIKCINDMQNIVQSTLSSKNPDRFINGFVRISCIINYIIGILSIDGSELDSAATTKPIGFTEK